MAANPRFLTYKGVTVYRELRDNREQAVSYDTVFSTDPFLNGNTFQVPHHVAGVGREQKKAHIMKLIDKGEIP